jgi:hypothetical protein
MSLDKREAGHHFHRADTSSRVRRGTHSELQVSEAQVPIRLQSINDVGEGRINDSIVAFDAAIAGDMVGSSLQVLNSQNDHQSLEHLASLIVYNGPRNTVMHDPRLV